MTSQERLWTAAVTNDFNSASSALAAGANPNVKNERGWSAMIMAAFEHSFEVFELLVKNGGDINDVNNNGTSVFMFAKTKCFFTQDYSFLERILDLGADVNLRDRKRNWTVLKYVEEKGDESLKQFLIERGAII